MELTVEDAKQVLKDAGYVVLKEKSYRQAQERQRVAECYRDAEIRAAESARDWARDCLAEERRLRDRCTFLYGAARAAGCTVEELAQTPPDAFEANVLRSGGQTYPTPPRPLVSVPSPNLP